MVRVLTEQRNGRRPDVLWHDHSSPLVQKGTAFPMIELIGSTPKYRPSSESADCQFMRNTSPSATTRQPCQTGSGRPRLSRSRATPIAICVDRDGEMLPANRLPRQRQHALQHRHVARQIIAVGEEGRGWFGRPDRDKLGDSQSACGAQTIKTDRHAFGSVPDIPGDRSLADR